MSLSYYPGCTLKTKAKNAEDSAIAAMAALGIELVELPRWNCCGTVYSFAGDEELHQLAPVRNLIRVKETGGDRVATICSFCYNTLKRANLLVTSNPEKMHTINTFMEEEIDYEGDVEVVHLLEVLRDDIGWETIAEKVQVPLTGLKVAPYYGCTLLRPQEIAIDDVERPTIMHDLLKALGADVVDFPYATECCGSYQIISNPDYVSQRVWDILSSAMRRKADAIVLSCPLCDANLGQTQKELMQTHSEFKGIPILYFTQLLALALGLDPEICRLELNYVDPRPLLESKELLRQ